MALQFWSGHSKCKGWSALEEAGNHPFQEMLSLNNAVNNVTGETRLGAALNTLSMFHCSLLLLDTCGVHKLTLCHKEQHGGGH